MMAFAFKTVGCDTELWHGWRFKCDCISQLVQYRPIDYKLFAGPVGHFVSTYQLI